MCEKRTRKIKKGSQLTQMREARRLQRIQRLSRPSTIDEPIPVSYPQVDKAAQKRVILELAWKTVALMHKNRLIQEKIIELQKETSEFIATMMNHPANQRRYMEHVRLDGIPSFAQTLNVTNKIPLKIEPNA